ncbi:MAG: UDP-3-O-[3-hydroxymyristoyl] N-acetylglucosamine deacetylase [Firmicutes bacterium]|nr:UDP-3-O-[3-hydroxymyristoyl] N-acetylglucosamine deacetylase [Bacillota bacterium]
MKGFQQTLQNKIAISGQALHSGKMVTMELIPQPVDTGIRFCRVDLPGQPVLPAKPAHVVDTTRSTSLGTKEWRIQTIEHLMAAFHGLGVDNLLVAVDGPEIPLGDGSAHFFVEEILRTGLLVQEKPRKVRKITTPVWVTDGKDPRAYLVALPGEGFRVTYCFTSDHKVTGHQFAQYLITPETFREQIAPARTIAFWREIEALRKQGLALGGNMEIAVVVGEEGYLNELRYPDEIVRHKILDILGDLYLLGPLEGEIIAVRSGHKLDFELTLKLEDCLE